MDLWCLGWSWLSALSLLSRLLVSLLSLLSLLERLLSLLGLLLDLMVQGKELKLLLSGEKRRSLMVVVPDFFRFASLVKPGILSSASLL